MEGIGKRRGEKKRKIKGGRKGGMESEKDGVGRGGLDQNGAWKKRMGVRRKELEEEERIRK